MSTSLTAAIQLAVLAIKFDVMRFESASPPGKKQLCLQWPRMAHGSASCAVLYFGSQLLQTHLLLVLSLAHISFWHVDLLLWSKHTYGITL